MKEKITERRKKRPRMSRKLLLAGIETMLEAKFGGAGVALIPKVRALNTMYQLRGSCIVSQTPKRQVPWPAIWP